MIYPTKPLKGQFLEIFGPLRLRALPPSVKFKSKIVLPTPRYAAQRVDSVLCRLAGSLDSALCRLAGSHDSALCRIGNIREFLCEFVTICKNILTR
jgi:hypothetical protein